MFWQYLRNFNRNAFPLGWLMILKFLQHVSFHMKLFIWPILDHSTHSIRAARQILNLIQLNSVCVNDTAKHICHSHRVGCMYVQQIPRNQWVRNIIWKNVFYTFIGWFVTRYATNKVVPQFYRFAIVRSIVFIFIAVFCSFYSFCSLFGVVFGHFSQISATACKNKIWRKKKRFCT